MSPTVPRLRLERAATAVRPFTRGDLDALLALRLSNREFMADYEADRADAFFTRAGQAREIALDTEAWAAGAGYAFAIVDRDAEDRLIGRIALSNVVRGPWQNATVGYWIDLAANGRNHATNALHLTCTFAFEHAGLHRVQPAIMPRNARSRRVVEKVGFRHEGTALRYLKIAGVWEDHDIFALTREDWSALRRAAATAS
ncbi:MAG: family N-acetyltransferase [Solirubrobacterales bacterium]|jgi:ribosomal-protein-alanine N-acetyltransferase|nr:family N-acetyltransferase [Solirubrobacterales bacterium]